MDALQIQKGDFSGDNKLARDTRKKESEIQRCVARGTMEGKATFPSSFESGWVFFEAC